MTTVFSFDDRYDLDLTALANEPDNVVYAHGDQEITETNGVHSLQQARSWADSPIPTPGEATVDERRLALIKQAASNAEEYIVVSDTSVNVDGWTHLTPSELRNYVRLALDTTPDITDEDTTSARDIPTPNIEESVDLVETAEGDPNNIPEVPLVDVEADALEGRWYLSVVLPEQVKPVTTWMHDHGETDAFIGKVVLHSMHDYNRSQDCVHLFTVRNTTGDNHYGVVAVVPDRDEYAHFFEQQRADVPRWHWSDVQVRGYGVPSESVVIELLEEFVDVEDWQNNDLGVWQR